MNKSPRGIREIIGFEPLTLPGTRRLSRAWRGRSASALLAMAVLGLLVARYEGASSSGQPNREPSTQIAVPGTLPQAIRAASRSETSGAPLVAQETGTSYDVLHSFSAETGYPQARLLQGTDGRLYGTASGGGVLGQGSVFVLTPDGTGGFTFTTLHSFASSDGAYPSAGLIQATDGNFYGTTIFGSASGFGNGYGTVFRMDASGNVATLHFFASGDGANPYAGLIQATDGDFYGTTQQGGVAGHGTAFKMDASGNVTTLHSFGNGDGASPIAGLIQATDGNFYGTTNSGGAGGYGTVFKMDGSGNVTPLHFFANSGGFGLYGSLIQTSDGSFYGTTQQGGVAGYGTAFKMDASGNVTTLHSFPFANSDGAGPTAGLIQATDGNFYGTTQQGGTSGYGTAFKMDASGNVTTLHSFGNGDGASPIAGLIQATDGNFYGTTIQGGAGGYGTAFKVSASGDFTTLHSFANSDGAYPYAGLIQATDGSFYGTTIQGGAGGYGTAFKVSASGDFTTLHSFANSDGAYPYAGLIQARDGSFYGATDSGGAVGYGTVFKMDASGNVTTLHSFESSGGAHPGASLIQATDGNFYGTTSGGGVGDFGTAFKVDASGNLTTLHSFASSDGAYPYAVLIQASDGNFYGTTPNGGAAEGGVIYRIAVTPVSSSTIFISSSGNPSTFGQPITFYASVTTSAGSPSGTVTFQDGANTLQTVPVTDTSPVSYTTTSLAVGTHTITAVYAATGGGGSTSAPLVQTVGQSGIACGGLKPAVAYTAGQNPQSVSAADFNGDGKLDLMVCNQGNAPGSGVSVLLGNGDGTFQPLVHYATGSNPQHAVIADVNGDGKPDLVSGNDASNDVSVLLGNGDGSFQPAVNFPAGPLPLGIAAGDLDGDGRIDLVVPNGSTTQVSVLMGNGDGTFQTPVAYAAGTNPQNVSIGDVSGDGKADIVVDNGSSADISILIGRGDGTFLPPVNYSVGGAPVSSAITDLNGDGKPDLVIASYAGAVSVLLGNGDGTFQPASHLNVSSDPYTVIIADLNTDGKPDIVVGFLRDSKISVLLGNGDGTFGSPTDFPSGSSPIGLAVGDFDGDLKPDVATADAGSGTTSIFLAGCGTTTALTSSANPSFIGDAVTFTATVTAAAGAPTGSVTFKDGTTAFGSANLSGGTASYTTSSLAAGNHSITATYSGDAVFTGSTSAVLQQVVNACDSPTATVTGTNSICAGSSATIQAALTGTAPWSVTWSDGLTQSAISASPATMLVSPSATTVYTVTAISDAKCAGTSSGSATITVRALPSVTISAGGPTTFCAGGSVTLTAAPSGGTGTFSSYQWYRNGVAIGAATTSSYSAGTSGAYTATVTDSAGCTSAASNGISVTATPLPTATVSGTTTICKGAATTIQAALTGTGPWNLMWSDGFTQTGVASSPATRSVAPNVTTTYSVTAISDAKCTGSSSGSAVITVQALPKATVSGDTTICAGSSATIQAALTGTPPWNLIWSDAFAQTVSASPATRTVSPSAQTTYSVTSVSDAACSGTSSGSATIKVNPAPSSVITAPATVCANSTGNTASVPNAGSGATYSWSITNGTITSGAGTRTITFSAGPSGTVGLTVVVTKAGCSSTGSASLAISLVPSAVITAPSSVCRNSTGNIASVPNAGPGATYAWAIMNGTITSGAGTSSITFSTGNKDVTLKVTVTNSTGCSSSSTITIRITC